VSVEIDVGFSNVFFQWHRIQPDQAAFPVPAFFEVPCAANAKKAILLFKIDGGAVAPAESAVWTGRTSYSLVN